MGFPLAKGMSIASEKGDLWFNNIYFIFVSINMNFFKKYEQFIVALRRVVRRISK